MYVRFKGVGGTVPKGFSASDRDGSLGSQKPEDIPYGTCLNTCKPAHGSDKRSQMLFGKPGVIHT